MTDAPVERDERTEVVENASYRWSYLTLSFGLLVLAAIRSFAGGEQPWDLLLLVIVGGGINAVYQGTQRVLSRRRLLIAVITAIAAALVAVIIVAFRR